MIQQSHQEYSYIKQAIRDTKSEITRYNLYIIGVTSFSGLTFKYLESKDFESLSLISVLFIALLTITYLFEIIWYKFKSHNRYTGYLQLLSQEIGYYQAPQHREDVSLEYIQKKLYLDNPGTPLNDSKKTYVKQIPDLITWEFLMNRLNNSKMKPGKERLDALISATEKCYFKFELPPDLSNCQIKNYEKMDSNYFEKIIWLQFDKKYSGYKRIRHILQNIKSLFKQDWSKRVAKDFQIDQKYISNGWEYPTVIFRIAFSQVILLIISFFLICYNRFDFFDIGSTLEIYPTIISILMLGVGFIWVAKYLRRIDGLMVGQSSIDYFCWTFFIYRIQILNSKGIMPSYFSRGYIRYLKSKIIHQNMDSYGTVASGGKCQYCELDAKRNFEHGVQSVLICEPCVGSYKNQLNNFMKFKEKPVELHEILSKKMKEESRRFECQCIKNTSK